ncbi:hypothetical protein EDD21DRAFT_358619 [Dissophora ornata]|nr:hypothetical protein BGZ58_008447 [Dissophora ornata]KAI8595909.1 hypothetical protein EDD21DRAFT_358619 [Dissophora ornata]
MLEEDVNLEVPRNNTFRQTQHLDAQVEEDLNRRRQEVADVAQQEYGTLRFKIDGNVVPLQVEIRSLKEILNLPNIDLNGVVNSEREAVPQPEEDMEGEDHAGDDQ